MDLNKLKQKHNIADEDEVEYAEEVKPTDLTPSVYTQHILPEEGDEIIDGKLYRKWQFKPGNDAHAKRKEGPRQSTTMKYAISIKDKRMFRNWMSTVGLERALTELQLLEGKDYLTAYLALAPYAMPKIASVEYKTSDDVSTEIGDRQTHTITIRDMRSGTVKVINDE